MTPQELFNKLIALPDVKNNAIAMHVLHRFHPLEYDNTDNYIHDLRMTTWDSGGLGLVYYGEASAMLADQAWRDAIDEYLESCYDATDEIKCVRSLDKIVIEVVDFWCDLLAELAQDEMCTVTNAITGTTRSWKEYAKATDGSTVTTME
jgi:hypothetical protein